MFCCYFESVVFTDGVQLINNLLQILTTMGYQFWIFRGYYLLINIPFLLIYFFLFKGFIELASEFELNRRGGTMHPYSVPLHISLSFICYVCSLMPVYSLNKVNSFLIFICRSLFLMLDSDKRSFIEKILLFSFVKLNYVSLKLGSHFL